VTVERGSNLTRDEARARARLVSDVEQEVRLDLTGGAEEYRMETVVRFACPEPGASTFLDLIATGVESVEVNGRAVPDAVRESRLELAGLEPRNEVRVVARVGWSHTGQGFHRFTDPVDDRVYSYTDFEPFDAHRAFACFDQPDIKAVFTFEVLAPANWVVVSNMAVDGEPLDEPPGARRWRFLPTPRLSAYITALAAGEYHVARDRSGDIQLGWLCRQSLVQYLEPDAAELFEITKQGFEFYSRVFRYPYPFGKYDQIFVPEFNSGAMENAGLVTYNEVYLFRSKVTDAARERRAETILHEMAHMWFGDLVTMRWWDDLWLNESFATFMSVLCQTQATRWRSAWTTFANSEKTWAYYQDQLPSTHPIVADMPDTESIHTNFDGITYAKGASVLRQLVAWVGEGEFLDGLAGYFRRHEYGNTDLSDFLSALEESSGRDLHAWSKEWLQTSGVNVLRAEFERGDATAYAGDGGPDGGRFTSFRVVQEAPAEHPVLRMHRVAVGLYDATGDGRLERRRGVELDIAGPSTEVRELVGERVPDLVLVNDRDLTYARIRLDRHSLQTLVERLGHLRDPLARALCWGAAWDMVRDAETPTREYLQLVLRNIAAETDVGVVQRILGQLASAIEAYGDPANLDAARRQLASAALAALEAAEPGSDFQLAWARAFASAASGDEHVGAVRGLLDGSRVIDGLAVDTDLRWHLLLALAEGGHAGEEEIRAELDRDPTDYGRRYAAQALASRPTAEAKAEAWDSITGDRTLTSAMLQSKMSGFQRPGQQDVLRPYVEPYFEQLGPMWEDRTLEVAVAFARRMYPGHLIEQATIDATDRHLDRDRVPGPIARTLVEGRDQLQRALRAQERDRAAAAATSESAARP
jgi:aminopeptidase N